MYFYHLITYVDQNLIKHLEIYLVGEISFAAII